MNRPVALVANVVRQWWALAVLVVAGCALAGILAGTTSDLTSTLYFRVDPSAEDSTRVTQSTQTAVRLIDTPAIFDTAGRALGVDPRALQLQTVVAVTPSSELVGVTARCRAADACARQLGAVADAVHASLEVSATQQFGSIASSGAAALAAGVLPDRDAERTRREAIGQTIADRQNGALATGSSLTVTGEPTPPERTGLTSPVGGAAGVLVGLVAVVLAALGLGRRVGRVRSPRDWTLRVGTEQCYDGDSVGRLAQRFSSERLSLVLVMPAGPDSMAETADLARSLRDEMELEGAVAALVRITRGAAVLVDDEGDAIAQVRQPLVHAYRSELLARARADVAIAYCDTPISLADTARGRVPAAVFLARGADARYRPLQRTLASLRPTSSYAVLA